MFHLFRLGFVTWPIIVPCDIWLNYKEILSNDWYRGHLHSIQWQWNVSTIGLVGWDNWPFEWILSCQMKMHFFSSTIVLLCSLRFLQRIRFITITFASESFVMHGLCSINCYHFIWWLDMVRVNMCTKVKIRKMITVLDKWIKKNETKTNQTNDHTGIHFQLIIISNLHMYVIVSKIKRKNRFYCGKTMIESK